MVARNKKTGLILPECRVRCNLRKRIPSKTRVFGDCTLYLTSAVEYVLNEILDLASEHVDKLPKSLKRNTIQPMDLFLGKKKDAELDIVVGDVHFPCCGVVPLTQVHYESTKRPNKRKQKPSVTVEELTFKKVVTRTTNGKRLTQVIPVSTKKVTKVYDAKKVAESEAMIEEAKENKKAKRSEHVSREISSRRKSKKQKK